MSEIAVGDQELVQRMCGDLQLDPEMTVGVVIAGPNETGKTTARGIIAGTLQSLDLEGVEPFALSLDLGYRGVTADMLQENDIDPFSPVGQEYSKTLVDRYSYAKEDDGRFRGRVLGFYVAPEQEDVLHSPAVGSVLPYASRDPYLHTMVVNAASRHLQSIIFGSQSTGRLRSPNAIVVEGHNSTELFDVLQASDISVGGIVLVTCSEDDSIRRRLPEGTSEAEVQAAIAQLRARNELDRNRPGEPGITTLPDDLEEVFQLGELIESGGEDMLFTWGYANAGNDRVALHVPTGNGQISLETERQYLPMAVRGMVAGAQRLSR